MGEVRQRRKRSNWGHGGEEVEGGYCRGDKAVQTDVQYKKDVEGTG